MTARTGGFERHRSLLFSIAYRMLGSSARQRADVEALLGDVYADDVAADRARGAHGTFLSSLEARTKEASVCRALHGRSLRPKPRYKEVRGDLIQSSTRRRGRCLGVSYAEALGAKRPPRVPAFLARVIAGDALVTWMLGLRGASNEKIKGELGWRSRYESWRQGFFEDVAAAVPGSGQK